MQIFNFIATTTFGLESIVKKEVEKLGFTNISVSDGIVNFSGTLVDIPKANIWLRCADRVLLVMGKFKATTFEQLFENTKKIDWYDFIPEKANFIISGKSVKSQLSSVPACQSITEKAIIEKMKLKYNLNRFEKTGEKYKIQVAILKDEVTLTIDTSGEALHKRGYRENQLSAPLKETMAASLIMLSHWKYDKVFFDPTCGSGTIPIEAGMIAKNIAPGINRKFASESWEIIEEKYWKEARKDAYNKIKYDVEPKIIASDIDHKAIKIAKANAEIAGVDDCITFSTKAFKDVRIRENFGTCICNPPYAERIGEIKDVEQLYRDMGQLFLKDLTWSVYVLTSNEKFEELYGKMASKKRKLFNGNVKVDYYQYFGSKPKKIKM